MTEEWRPVVGYEGLYEVSSFGSVRNASTKRVLRGNANAGGKSCAQRRYVSLSRNGKSHTKKVHRLVAEAFIPNPNCLREVNHINGDALNNCVWNLEWCTTSQNIKHAYAHGLTRMTKSRRQRIANSQSRPVERDDGVVFKSVTEAARSMGCHVGSISSVLNGRRETIMGHRFKFVGEAE